MTHETEKVGSLAVTAGSAPSWQSKCDALIEETRKMVALPSDGCVILSLAAQVLLARKEIARLQRFEARMKWLHDCSTGCADAEGYEWGIYRVKWVNGQPAEVWHTNSDFSDLDGEMARELSLQNAQGDQFRGQKTNQHEQH